MRTKEWIMAKYGIHSMSHKENQHRVAVNCRNWKEYILVLMWHYKMKHKWKSGSLPINFYSIFFWKEFKSNTVVSLSDKIVFNTKPFFEENGLKVIDFIQFNEIKNENKNNLYGRI